MTAPYNVPKLHLNHTFICRDVVLTEKVWERIKKIAILKQIQSQQNVKMCLQGCSANRTGV